MLDVALIDGTAVNTNEETYNERAHSIGNHLVQLKDIGEVRDIYFLTHYSIDHRYRNKHIKYIGIRPLDKNDYQHFSIKELGDYCHADHLMTCQWDGLPLNFDLWDDSFLDYDFIGAPWSYELINQHLAMWYEGQSHSGLNALEFPDRYMVGNSGFCIRSKRFFEVSKISPFPISPCMYHGDHLSYNVLYDDWFFGLTCRWFFELRGIQYADPVVASIFSLEAHQIHEYGGSPLAPKYNPDGTRDMLLPKDCATKQLSFGIHGQHICKELAV